MAVVTPCVCATVKKVQCNQSYRIAGNIGGHKFGGFAPNDILSTSGGFNLVVWYGIAIHACTRKKVWWI